MKITILGTSSGIPTKQRNLSAVALQPDQSKEWLLVDCGEATQHQLLHTPLSLRNLSAICITHVHGDHCYGLPGLVASAQMAGREQPLKIIAPKGIELMLKTIIECTDMHIQYPIEYYDVAELSLPVELAPFSITPIELSHRVPSFAYKVALHSHKAKLNAEAVLALGVPKGPLWGELQQGKTVTLDDGRTVNGEDCLLADGAPMQMIVAGDNDQPQLLAAACTDSQLLIHEATYTQAVLDKVGPKPQHSSAKQVCEMVEQAGLNNLILTHFSARFKYGDDDASSINQVAEEARRYYSGEVFLANDFDQFHLTSEGELVLLKSNQATPVKM